MFVEVERQAFAQTEGFSHYRHHNLVQSLHHVYVRRSHDLEQRESIFQSKNWPGDLLL